MTQNTLNYYCYNSKLVFNCAFLTFSICINTKINIFHENLKAINKVTQNKIFFLISFLLRKDTGYFIANLNSNYLEKINICSYM